MAYNEKTYLLRMSREEYDLIKKVAGNMRRSIKDAILYSIEQQSLEQDKCTSSAITQGDRNGH